MDTRETRRTVFQVSCRRCSKAITSYWDYCPHCGAVASVAARQSLLRRGVAMTVVAVALTVVGALIHLDPARPTMAQATVLPSSQVVLPASEWAGPAISSSPSAWQNCSVTGDRIVVMDPDYTGVRSAVPEDSDDQ